MLIYNSAEIRLDAKQQIVSWRILEKVTGTFKELMLKVFIFTNNVQVNNIFNDWFQSLSFFLNN